MVFCFNPKNMAITDAKLDRPSVVGGASIYPAVENLLLACRAEGLGCVLTTLLCMSEPEVRELFEIPQPWATAAAIPIGYPLARGHGKVYIFQYVQLTEPLVDAFKPDNRRRVITRCHCACLSCVIPEMVEVRPHDHVELETYVGCGRDQTA